MKKSQRVAVLVDSENLEIAVSKDYLPPKDIQKTHIAYPDWLEILPRLVGQRELVRAIYYKKRGKSISKKFRSLWEREFNGEIKQPIKSVDPYIVIDAITLAEKADAIILLAGDKDYLPLIWYLRSKGCKVEMASFPEAAAAEIRAASDTFHRLGEQDTVVLERSF